jgi:hypothetical protein
VLCCSVLILGSAGSSSVGLIVGLCILFIVIIPLLVLAAVCGYKHRRRLVKYSHKPTGSRGNTSERRLIYLHVLNLTESLFMNGVTLFRVHIKVDDGSRNLTHDPRA